MNINRIIAGIAVCTLPFVVNAQSTMNMSLKWDGTIQKNIREKTKLSCVIIKCTDSEAVARTINRAGYQATIITSTILTARIPSDYIPRLATSPDVRYMQSARQCTASMTEARIATGADKVQSGEGLDTPYTGKGVIIGVIDQGFEYRHIAFLDNSNKSRVIALWNRKGYSAGTDSDPTTTIPATGDGFDSYGHATHVTNIAAGSKISENDYYGMAPDADIIMIPSEFIDTEVIEDVKYISDLAKQRGEPWVVNMSFGTQRGSHDGTNYFCQALDQIVADGYGHQIVTAAGNDGFYVQHSSYTFKNDKDTVRLLIEPGSSGAFVDIWGQCTDSIKHLQVTPYIYASPKKEYKDSIFWSQYVNTFQIAPYNKKEEYEFGVSSSVLGSGYELGVEISGDKGTTFHAWTNQGYGNIVNGPDTSYLKGDQNYCVEALASSANNDVTVGAFVTSNTYKNCYGTTVPAGYGGIGDIAVFSSTGPSLCDSPKPTVCAPGAMIKSAVSKYGASFSKSGSDVVQDISRGIKHFYYSAMPGTSMATPAVTGIIALWLQANPRLTYSEILGIIKSTSTKDAFTGSEEWNAKWGYGKINAYEGLKAALKQASADGLTRIYNSSTPITISKENGLWRFLFNNDERFADICIYDMNGILVDCHHFKELQQGQEVMVSFTGIKHGVYILKIRTAGCNMTKKYTI